MTDDTGRRDKRPPTLSPRERSRRRGDLSPLHRLGAPVVLSVDAERAITIIEGSRDTHLKWIEYLSHPLSEPVSEDVGDIAHHRATVEDYDFVLSVLRRVAPEVPQ